MPVSKNKRKSKKAQSRKVNRAKAEGNFGGGGAPPAFDYPPPLSPSGVIPELMPLGTSIDENRRYKVNSPDDPALSETEQIDAIIERSVNFEMTEAHHDNIGLREIDLDGEIGGDFQRPMMASVEVDPLSTIEGHPRWQTGQELIDFLDSDPNVFRNQFDGNRWQGLGVTWVECLPEVENCPYRLEEDRTDGPPECWQCESGMRAEEVHFHILDDDGFVTMCRECWSKGPLPEENRTLQFEFQFHGE
jgi:hypothetical protein